MKICILEGDLMETIAINLGPAEMAESIATIDAKIR